ncbi:hypothetical protein PR048_020114 [Dryococelus australis]|uniref:Uncharacterized protein n=1 Tax=Dryococelus australis TaxID=614101 RepID=A0ABQ9H5F4_9NEOP|nr:hypothetical protein PR048_020114 [Dryococelus australis]
MTIETKLMRSFKTITGLTWGRDISDSVISKWIVEMSATHDICASQAELYGVLFSSSKQHVDFSMTRITRNTADISKLVAWLENHPPFPIMSEIMSIATGVVGDCKIINCYEAVTIGKQAMGKIESGTAKETSLNHYRYQVFVTSVANIKPDISSLPPIEGVARQHFCRTYLQVQQWLGNELSPELWKWECTPGNHLAPVHTEDPVAVEVGDF